ncbi:iron-sulfur cluster assembly scaffold protein [Aquibaculum arenosum]|uniref:Iron-sulfur cluster assembly scaffold protein n=1 Tax=Aquibaculum arenosum TaxID=3032591 RepID=A0ABT5YMM4_9PROT|nr:iron-sulfur cluster assembly scaffold protein [Fodinicurvata sp. CAU 1616]MDF2096212.1 iron-sulfur cluster assembly scaffold protein [Fodinicurvata sp. CAU 1616]
MDDDLLDLYSERLMAHGRRVAADRRLAEPDVTVFRRSPLCGSTVTLDLCFEQGRITDLGYAVRACSLGQVGVSVLSELLPGRSFEEARAVTGAVRAMLAGQGPPPEGDWAELELLEPAIELRNRHGSVMLPFEAVLQGIEEAEGQ